MFGFVETIFGSGFGFCSGCPTHSFTAAHIGLLRDPSELRPRCCRRGTPLELPHLPNDLKNLHKFEKIFKKTTDHSDARRTRPGTLPRAGLNWLAEVWPVAAEEATETPISLKRIF